MISKQNIKIKSSIIDMNNQINGIFTSFDSLNLEFHPGNRLIYIFYLFITPIKALMKAKIIIARNLMKLFSNHHYIQKLLS